VKYQLARRLVHLMERDVPIRSTQSASGFAVGSLRGPVREDNQDRALVADVSREDGFSARVGIVCDGLGGMTSGGLAASWAASVFLAEIVSSISNVSKESLAEALRQANEVVFNQFGGEGGTTLTALVSLSNGANWVIHVGDSRLYIIDENNALKLLTIDDTVVGVANNGSIDEDLLDNRLLQFVGVGDEIEPHIFLAHGTENSDFILTSDGAHGLGRKLLEDILLKTTKPVDWVRRIIYVSDAIGVTDNATAIAISSDSTALQSSFGEGVCLKVWTANDVLELWLQDNIPTRKHEAFLFPKSMEKEDPDSSAVLETMELSPEPKPEPEPKRKAKPKRKPKPVVKKDQPANDVSKGTSRPQLSIKFDDESNSKK
jgi:PPM family protein phosphatase